MAKFYPTYEEILHLKVEPQPGELRLLNLLKELPDSYEVYFQPFLNGDRPDAIIVKKDHGVLIIEVKDWNLDHYYLDERARWFLKKNDVRIKSPIDQVYTYKKNIFQLHVASFIEKQVFDAKFWHIVKCAVYFSEMPMARIEQLQKKLHEDPKRKGFLSKNVIIYHRELQAKFISYQFESIKKSTLNRFGEEEYNELTRFLRPTEFDYEQFFNSKPINFTQQQKRLIVSEPREQWIKGVVGSGKTTVLAARAAEANKRVNDQILILTYNITLKNYIHDKISRVRGKYDPEKFYITHYDQFISTQMNNYGLEYNIPKDFDRYTKAQKSEFFAQYHDNVNLFETVKDRIHKYKVILIDETQDFKKVWMDVVKKYFLEENGEYVLFSDEKQNIYNRFINNRDITTNVAQRPTALKQSVRSTAKLKETFIDYQQEFLESKYNVDERVEFLQTQIGLNFTNEKIIYHKLSGFDVVKLFNVIVRITKELKEHPKACAILGETTTFLRDFDLYYRVKTNEKTNTIFEKAEVYMGILISAILNTSKDSFEENSPGRKKFQDLQKLFPEVHKLLPEKMSVRAKHKRIAILLAKTRIAHKIKEDKLYKANAETQDELLKNAEVVKWIEQFLSLCVDFLKDLPKNDRFLLGLERRTDDVRDGMKSNFWFHGDGLKISTIHSFKGWEAGTLFLIIEPDFRSEADAVHELIYTSITRAKNNLIVLNFGNEHFDELFQPFFIKHKN